MAKIHQCLISAFCFSKDAANDLSSVAKSLKKDVKFQSFSSVYQVFGERESSKGIHDLKTVENFNGLCLTLRGQTELEPGELITRLSRLEKPVTLGGVQTMFLYLLAFDNEVSMTPGLCLPYPGLHQSPQFLIPASEAWPNYEHPVLNKPLIGLAKEHSVNMWGEFHSQAQAILDF